MFADVSVIQNKTSLWFEWGFQKMPPTDYLHLDNKVISSWQEPSFFGVSVSLLDCFAKNTRPEEAMRFPFSQKITFSPA